MTLVLLFGRVELEYGVLGGEVGRGGGRLLLFSSLERKTPVSSSHPSPLNGLIVLVLLESLSNVEFLRLPCPPSDAVANVLTDRHDDELGNLLFSSAAYPYGEDSW